VPSADQDVDTVGQATVAWAQVVDDGICDDFNSVAVASDGDIVAVGSTSEADPTSPNDCGGPLDALAVAFAPDGTKLWTRIYGGTGDDVFSDVVADPGGGLVVGGTSASTGGDLQPPGSTSAPGNVMVRLDAAGNIVWVRSYAAGDIKFLSPALVTSQGIFTLGLSTSTGPYNARIVAKLTLDGDIVWHTVYRADPSSFFVSMAVDQSGNVIAAGLVGSGNSRKGLLAKFDRSGSVVWGTTWGSDEGNGFGGCQFTGVVVSADDQIVTSGYGCAAPDGFSRQPTVGVDSTDADIVIFTQDGQPIWSGAFGGSGPDFFTSLSLDTTGSVVAVGYTSSLDGDFSSDIPYGGSRGLVAKLNTSGDLLSTGIITGNSNIRLSSIAPLPDGNVVAVGISLATDGMLAIPSEQNMGAAIVCLTP